MKTGTKIPGTPHVALVRGDDGSLHIRHFTTATDATAAANGRELPSPVAGRDLYSLATIEAIAGSRTGHISHLVFAKKLGIPPKIVRAQFKRGGLPGAVEHSAHWIMIPTALLRLATAYGLRGVERMAKAGLLAGGAS